MGLSRIEFGYEILVFKNRKIFFRPRKSKRIRDGK